MPLDLESALREHFGFPEFKPGQLEVIEHLVAGRSAAAVFPTGGGKSICYQLPALLFDPGGLTLVVSPLIALMKDQIDALGRRGIAARRLDSTLTAEEYRGAMDQVRTGALRLLYVAPERFNNERFRESIQAVPIALFAVDEAHCISEWGHNFRPDYLKLAQFARQCAAKRILALTATATEKVLADICRAFRIMPQCAVRTGFYRPNLTLQTTPVDSSARDQVLLGRLQERPAGPTIVYVTLQRTAEQVAQRISQTGIEARPYHAGMEDQDRASAQDWFLGSDRAVIVATIAFGMGIDKPDIRFVYHYNLPKSLENYAQEIGRAGRDDKPSTCHMLVCPDDLNTLENFVYGDTPTLEAVQALVREIFSLEDEFDIGVHELSSRHDIRVLVVRTLLTYLELLGYLEGGTPFYSSYRLKPLRSSSEILERFEGPRRQFLASVFTHVRKARTWMHLDVDAASTALGEDRQRIVRALEYLGQQQMLEVEAAGVRFRYRRLKSPDDPEALAADLHGRTAQREAREIQRLHQVMDFVQHDGCQVSHLGAHFGESLETPCGHCTWCLNGHEPVALPPRAEPAIDQTVWGRARALRAAHGDILSDPRNLARLLCGVSSPSLVRAKLARDPLFGSLGHVPFLSVLQQCEGET